jgi:hypothetical protein
MEIEESLNELSFHKSCQTKVLKTKSVFLSAYPGFITFGKTFEKSYLSQSYFKFFPFELYKLYIAIINILKFLTEDETASNGDLILKRSDTVAYFWKGVNLNVNGKNKKCVLFCIETTENVVKISMTLSELHNFIIGLKSTIIICLCLNTIENELIIEACNQELDSVLKLKDYSKAKVFVEQFVKKNNNIKKEDCFQLAQLLTYYFDIIILVHKFISMSNFEENVIQNIISAT